MKKIILSLVIAIAMFMSPVFAGNSNQSGQSGQSSQAGQSHNGKKKCFFKKIKKTVKKSIKKTKKVVKKSYKKAKKSVKKSSKKAKKCAHKAYDSAQNKVMDTGVATKKKITCKKNKTWVKGHYKNGKHTKGHWRKVGKGKR